MRGSPPCWAEGGRQEVIRPRVRLLSPAFFPFNLVRSMNFQLSVSSFPLPVPAFSCTYESSVTVHIQCKYLIVFCCISSLTGGFFIHGPVPLIVIQWPSLEACVFFSHPKRKNISYSNSHLSPSHSYHGVSFIWSGLAQSSYWCCMYARYLIGFR